MGVAAGVAIGLAMYAAQAGAQTYQCSASGTTYLSSRPCPPAAPRIVLGGYGPQRTVTYGGPSSIRAAPPAEGHVQYLSTECATISEGIRTGPARGVRYDVIGELQKEYRAKCSIDDSAARQRASQDASDALASQRDQRAAVDQRKVVLAQQSERCINMRDTIALRRKRESTLEPGEVANLRSFESIYNAQCLGR